MFKPVSNKTVDFLVENSAWAEVCPSLGIIEETYEQEEGEDSVEDKTGFYQLEEGLMVYLDESDNVYDVLQDEEDNIFLHHEDFGLFKALSGDNEKVILEEVDSSEYSLLEEDTDNDQKSE